ncbi:hypothetical protein [Streptomyces sp. C1-2]|uniref:hypothetical protein n=1 Tax=Streptomyces sp. C1-2 TaxID=2720022 RepID=UPI0014325B41|nr:hypothetical protein [Streptomyces sp. C1-2]NJP75070.1 hypothetical protein [Streptomyces sp. C1-2]
MSIIDELLAQSRLLHQPVPSDVVPYDDCTGEDDELWDDYEPGAADDHAAQSLAALCEAVVTHCAAAEQLADFLTDQVPQPRAAWILGCVLQLAGAHDGARFWWQYAAGADDAPASYCLYLQHLAEGDTHAAALWQTQIDPSAPSEDDTEPDENASAHRMTADTSLDTVLRILSRLNRAAPRKHTPTAQAVIDFVANAVTRGYHRHPDLEIPVPGPHFAECLEVVIAVASNAREGTRATGAETSLRVLPNRLSPNNTTARIRARTTTTQDPADLLVEVTTSDHEETSTHAFFKEAAAVCWKTATAANRTDGDHGDHNRTSYRLRRYAQMLSPAPVRFASRRASSPQGPMQDCFHRL